MPLTPRDLKRSVLEALQAFSKQDVKKSATNLFATLGYSSERTLPGGKERLFELTKDRRADRTQDPALFAEEWLDGGILFQLTTEDIGDSSLFAGAYEARDSNSYLFAAVELQGEDYARGKLAKITRAINAPFAMPTLVLFKYGDQVTLAVIDRRTNKRDEDKDVLEKVTLIKDISIVSPHRAHIDILSGLALESLASRGTIETWAQLHAAWKSVLNISELNKEFYAKIANWYFWAKKKVTFPVGTTPDKDVRNSTNVIRLITRVMFIWFLKERGLIPEELFDQDALQKILDYKDPKKSTYYKAILQNLFFATLNKEMDVEGQPKNRKWSKKSPDTFFISTLYRYQNYFNDPPSALKLFNQVPFLNGGLFECLDARYVREEGNFVEKRLQVDGFSDRPDNPLVVPDELFFATEKRVDLSAEYDDDRRRAVPVQGLIEILKSYKFTISENTPIEEEVALDPELLGKVFENLLASYNPETGATARRQTGSFYTPREIVDYMVEESLISYLSGRIDHDEGDNTFIENLRSLTSYAEAGNPFTRKEDEIIDAINNLKILDPACGSGAFPMGVLHWLVFILGKLDPHNLKWKERQVKAARELDDPDARENALKSIEEAFVHNELDYGRKLYLIERCIYGVDIQPIAVQIAKLRFFISLLIDQRIDRTRENLGIRPLPNLETKFIAANALLPLSRPVDGAVELKNLEIEKIEEELKQVRRSHISASNSKKKKELREKDVKLTNQLAEQLRNNGFDEETTRKLIGWDPYNQNSSAPFFEPEWMFNIEQGDGFDVVLGNPPYVRHEHIDPTTKEELQSYKTATRSNDLLIYFYELGYNVLRSGGTLALITSNKFMRASYGAKLRQFLKAKTTLHSIVDFGDLPVFDFLSYPAIIIFKKTSPIPTATFHGISIKEESHIRNITNVVRKAAAPIPQASLESNAWRIESRARAGLMDKLRSKGKPLAEYVNGNFYRGVLTGYNEAFVIDTETRRALIKADKSSARVIKPYLRGRDIKRYAINDPGLFIIYVENGWTNKTRGSLRAESHFKASYPAIHRHLKEHEERLDARDDQGEYWWEMRPCRYLAEFEKPKIVYPDIATSPQFAYSDSTHYFGNTSYIIPSDEVHLVAILNSSVSDYFLRSLSPSIQGGYLRFIAAYMSQIPIPSKDGKVAARLETLTRRLHKVGCENAEGRTLTEEIDNEVFRLFELNSEEIAVIREVQAEHA